MTDDLLTFDEAARLAYVSTETIKYWVKTKRISTVPKRISVRSGKPYGQLVRRSDLTASLVSRRIQTFNEEHGVQLKNPKQLAAYFGVTDGVARTVIRKLDIKKYKLFPNSVDVYVDLYEVTARMSEDEYYWMYVPTALELKRLACGCKFCYI